MRQILQSTPPIHLSLLHSQGEPESRVSNTNIMNLFPAVLISAIVFTILWASTVSLCQRYQQCRQMLPFFFDHRAGVVGDAAGKNLLAR